MKFIIEGTSPNGSYVIRKIDAPTSEIAKETANQQGIYPTAIHPDKGLFGNNSTKLSQQQTFDFIQAILPSIEIGAPIEKALTFVEQHPDAIVRQAAQSVLHYMQAHTFPEAVEKSGYFDSIFQGTIRDTKIPLEDSFNSLSKYYSVTIIMNSKIGGLLISPIIVAFLAFASLCYIILFGAQKSEAFYTDLGIPIHPILKFELILNHLIITYWPISIVLTFFTIYCCYKKRATLFHWFNLGLAFILPSVKGFHKNAQQAMVARIFSILAAAGVSHRQIFHTLSDITAGTKLSKQLIDSDKIFDSKGTVQDALAPITELNPDLKFTIEIGLSSGDISKTVSKYAESSERKVIANVDNIAPKVNALTSFIGVAFIMAIYFQDIIIKGYAMKEVFKAMH